LEEKIRILEKREKDRKENYGLYNQLPTEKRLEVEIIKKELLQEEQQKTPTS
jgi:hypothetical protein